MTVKVVKQLNTIGTMKKIIKPNFGLTYLLSPHQLSEGRGFSNGNFFRLTRLSVASVKNVRMSQNPLQK